MKKIFALIAVAVVLPLCSITLSAQNARPGKGERPTREQILDHQSREMATNLGLEGDKTDDFIAIYKDFKSEIFKVWSTAKKTSPNQTDEEIEASIKSGFETSHKVLDIREAYYAKFREVLSPAQIQKMYFLENHKGASSHMRHRGGPHGHKPSDDFANPDD